MSRESTKFATLLFLTLMCQIGTAFAFGIIIARVYLVPVLSPGWADVVFTFIICPCLIIVISSSVEYLEAIHASYPPS